MNTSGQRTITVPGAPQIISFLFPFYEPGMSFHTLRHSYAAQMARKGVPITFIQQQMGHWNPMTNAHHIHLPPLSSKQKERPLYVKRDRKNDQKEK